MLKSVAPRGPISAHLEAHDEGDVAEQADHEDTEGPEVLVEHQHGDGKEDLQDVVEGDVVVPDGVQDPEQAGAKRVHVERAESGLLLGGDGGSQGLTPKPVPSPTVPTREEYEKHILTHIPY